jgi:hypothetical protein
MKSVVIKTRGGNKYFYLNSVVVNGNIKHVVAGFNSGVIITLVDSGLEVDTESLVKMRSEYNDR